MEKRVVGKNKKGVSMEKQGDTAAAMGSTEMKNTMARTEDGTDRREDKRNDEPWPPADENGRLQVNDAAIRLVISHAMIDEMICRGMLKPMSVVEDEVIEIAADRPLLSLLRRADRCFNKREALDKEVDKIRSKSSGLVSKLNCL